MGGGFIFDPRFVEAFQNRQHIVLGQSLLPFSLWHKFQLEVADSPLMLGESIAFDDLWLAVLVCQTKFPEIASIPQTRWARYRRVWLSTAYRLKKEVAAFDAYCADFASPPRILTKTGDSGATPEIDDSLREAAFYRKMTGCPRNEPWDLPMGEVLWMNAVFAKHDGAEFSVLTPMDDEALARMRAKAAEENGQT